MSRGLRPRLFRRRGGRYSRHTVLALGALGLGLMGAAAIAEPAPLLVWNASASAPIGLYRLVAGQPGRGDLVLVQPPEGVARLAAERGYLPLGVPLVKRIAALAGDRVCGAGGGISIDGIHVASILARDGWGRSMPRWSGCRTLGSGEVFLLMAGVSESFDSRYFGPIPATAVIGRLAPLWTR